MANSSFDSSFRHDWQEQVLQQVDVDELGSAAYDELMEQLSSLVLWSDTVAQSLALGGLRQQAIWRSDRCLNTRAGYLDPTTERQQDNQAYLGDPWHHSLRYRMQSGPHWQAGLSLDIDAGESWRTDYPGFDSWHAFVRAQHVSLCRGLELRDAVVGHYRLRMGCGLLINQGFSLGKRYLTQQLSQVRSNVIVPMASTAEYDYLQGTALDLRLGHGFTLLPYFSARQLDGTVTDRQEISALYTDGMHRTRTEAGRRDAAWEVVTGARLGWQGEWYDLGLHLHYTSLQYDYIRRQSYYNTHYFRGHQLTQYAFDYRLHALGGVLRGELAVDDHAGLASLTMLRYSLSDSWSSCLTYRYYSRQYHQLHASSLSENSEMQGEQGVTLNLDGQLSRHWQMQGLIDWFHFSQPQYGIRDSTTSGFEGMVRALYSYRRASGMIAYRIKQKGSYTRHSFDGTLTLQPTASLTLKTQLRTRLYLADEPSLGYSASQSVAWSYARLRHCQFSIEGQAGYFHTDDYDSRIYHTERTVLYGFGLPMLYGEGLRYSLTSVIRLGSHLSLDLKWAMTNYANRSTISSGLQQIQGNTQQDLWLQLRLSI